MILVGHRVLFFLLCTTLVQNLSAQGPDPIHKRLVEPLDWAANNMAPESVYLQTSKGTYETGEDLWFKGIVLNARHLIPSAMGSVMYVQLIEDATGTAVWEERYGLANGFVDGHLYLRDGLPPGDYTLAAYTPYSLYGGEGPIGSIRKVRLVSNIASGPESTGAEETEKGKGEEIDFQLFPEGGHLVAGILCRVAFKAVDGYGGPRPVSGTLYANDRPLATIKGNANGMGSFSMVPQTGVRYHVALDPPQDGTPRPLPPVRPKGHVLRLTANGPGALAFNVSKTDTTDHGTVYLRVQQRGTVYAIARTELGAPRQVRIPLEGLPRGIVEATLFDGNMRPVAERLVFVNPQGGLHITASPDAERYPTKGKVRLKLKATDPKGSPVVAHLGLSVFDRAYANPADPKTIETHYLLSTQIRGDIHDPGQYFDPGNTHARRDLDLLMLTQGWRAYRWSEERLAGTAPKGAPPVREAVTGKIYPKKAKGRDLMGQQMVMAFTADQKGMSLLQVDSTGSFQVPPKVLGQAGNGYLYLKLLDTDFRITVTDPYFDRVNGLRKGRPWAYPIPGAGVPPPADGTPYVLANRANMLDGVLVSAEGKRIFRDRYMGTLDSLAKLEMDYGDYVGIPCNTLNCQIHDMDQSKKPIEGKRYYQMFGFKWADESRNAYTISGDGHIIYKYPELSEEELLRKFNLAAVKGYYGQREFYSPVYDTGDDGFPDFRNTLFWKPDIVTDANGEATIEFHCSDIDTRFIGIVEGLDGDGKIGRQTFEFRVVHGQ